MHHLRVLNKAKNVICSELSETNTGMLNERAKKSFSNYESKL